MSAAVKTNLKIKYPRKITSDEMPARFISNRAPHIAGAHADYRREDYMFQRTQSQAMRELEWEDRVKPMRPWAPNFVANLAFEIFA